MNWKQRIKGRSGADARSSPCGERERRTHPRYQVHKIVSYAHGGKQLLTVAMNFSIGGMKIKTHQKLPKNERMNFKLVLGNHAISAEGRVVYSRTLFGKQELSGIQFLGFSQRNCALLRVFLSALEE